MFLGVKHYYDGLEDGYYPACMDVSWYKKFFHEGELDLVFEDTTSIADVDHSNLIFHHDLWNCQRHDIKREDDGLFANSI